MSAFAISSLWRYPVKSMAGEELNTVDVTASGLRGDRAYALVDAANGKVGSAKNVKRFGELLKYRAQFVTPPESDGVVPPVRITLPDGTSFNSTQPNAQAVLGAAFGPQASLRSTAPDGPRIDPARIHTLPALCNDDSAPSGSTPRSQNFAHSRSAQHAESRRFRKPSLRWRVCRRGETRTHPPRRPGPSR